MFSKKPLATRAGARIIAFTFLNIDKYDPKTEELDYALGERAEKWFAHNSKIIFVIGGEGLHGNNCIMISIHRDFTDYTDFIADFRAQWGTRLKDMDSFLVSLKTKMPKPFSFRNLEILP